MFILILNKNTLNSFHSSYRVHNERNIRLLLLQKKCKVKKKEENAKVFMKINLSNSSIRVGL